MESDKVRIVHMFRYHALFCEFMARELHREVCQKLTAAKLELDILALDTEADGERLSRATSCLRDGIREIRELMEVLEIESDGVRI